MVKVTYEQMRRLAKVGDGPQNLSIKNRDGKVLRPTLKKWGLNATPKETKSMCTAGQQKPSPAHTGSPSQTFQRVSSLPLPRRPGKQ